MDLELPDIDLESIPDAGMRRCVAGLLNIIQQLAQQNRAQQVTIQAQRDEIARLKGEQPKPSIPPNKDGKKKNHSSEKQRNDPKPPTAKREAIQVDRIVPCPIDKATLPSDAQSKGTETRVVQEILVQRDNIAFEREKFYSPSLNKTFLAPLPQGFSGYFFGPNVRAMALTLYNAMGTSEPKILEWFAHMGIHMSAGELSNLLVRDITQFHEEKAEVFRAGLESSPWQHIDDTSTRVDGVGHYCHIVSNPLFTIYSTTRRKDRLTVLTVLRGHDAPRFLVNEETFALAKTLGVSEVYFDVLRKLPQDQEMDEATFRKAFLDAMGFVGEQARRKMFDAASIAAYHAQTEIPVVHTLLSDDAKQFRVITWMHGLCWIHAGRHFTKLTPFVEAFQKELEAFQDRFWGFYRKLRTYRDAPSPQAATQLEKDFDTLFSETPSYQALADRIRCTRANKTELLLVLKHPELPLHNNDAELAARARVRKRDVSFGPRTEAGRRAWDTQQSLVGTLKKLGQNVYEYFADRVRGLGKFPRLAEIIRKRALVVHLGASWALPAPSG